MIRQNVKTLTALVFLLSMALPTYAQKSLQQSLTYSNGEEAYTVLSPSDRKYLVIHEDVNHYELDHQDDYFIVYDEKYDEPNAISPAYLLEKVLEFGKGIIPIECKEAMDRYEQVSREYSLRTQSQYESYDYSYSAESSSHYAYPDRELKVAQRQVQESCSPLYNRFEELAKISIEKKNSIEDVILTQQGVIDT